MGFDAAWKDVGRQQWDCSCKRVRAAASLEEV
jgi:hypothetical protein